MTLVAIGIKFKVECGEVLSRRRGTCFANQVRSRADGCASMKNRGEGDTIKREERGPARCFNRERVPRRMSAVYTDVNYKKLFQHLNRYQNKLSISVNHMIRI